MTKIALALVSAATLAVAGGVAYAQAPERPLRSADMTRADVEQRTAAAFEQMDANDDGVLDDADREARKSARSEARFERLDADKDGAISRVEFDAAHDQARERFAERREGDHRSGHRARGKHRGHFAGRGMFARTDRNGDKPITQAEFTAAALERFDRADADNDGTVTAAERREARRAFRDQRRARAAEQS